MKNIFIGLLAFILLISVDAMAYHDKAWNKARAKNRAVNASGCSRANSSRTIEYNNVRALIHTGGDMWWDLVGTPKYEVPKNSGKTALFAGAIWMGGTDINDQLRLAAQKFRSTGVDYWTGPLITSGMDRATVTPDVCLEYDKHFVVDRKDVNEFRNYINAKLNGDVETIENQYQGYKIPDIILNWPGDGKVSRGYDPYLAPYYDNDASGDYNPETGGDYPYFDLDNKVECGTSRELRKPRLFGDQTMWWVYNDKGNVHTETNGEAIGMEVRAQYFAFATADELNNMTFGNYALINRSTYTLYNAYFGVWSDADLGYAGDDFVGCDVTRGLGYLYNGDDEDGTGNNTEYGKNPPAIGVDFFEGPYMDPYVVGGDTLDRPSTYILDENLNSTGVIDESMPLTNAPDGLYNGGINGLNFGDEIGGNERWGMRRFLYFNNDFGNQGDPVYAQEYYNYLDGFWRDGRPLVFGGTGYSPSGGTKAHFMFPGDTDPYNWGTEGIDPEYTTPGGWTEENEANNPDDRRFVQSAGPFTLLPGAVNDITVGMVWARASSGTAFESVKKVQEADDKAQKLFDNCFKMIDGPDSPELTITELKNELIIQISNAKGLSNNYTNIPEDYAAIDPFIVLPTIDEFEGLEQWEIDSLSTYKFEGYQVFQVKDPSVTTADLDNPEYARQIFQCDVKNDVTDLINYTQDPVSGKISPQLMVTGNNTGIQHTFKVTEDAFALAEKALVNHKEYYFIAVAYSHNEYRKYAPDEEDIKGQKLPYLRGRKSATGSIKTFKATPHINQIQDGGLTFNSSYGDGIAITMVEGMGNGNNILNLNQTTLDKIMSGSPWKTDEREYNIGAGPINVFVVDPLNIKNDDYILRFDSVVYANDDKLKLNGYINSANWYLYSASEANKTLDTTLTVMINDSLGIVVDTILPIPMPIGLNVLKSSESFEVYNGDTMKYNGAIIEGFKLYPEGAIFSEKAISIDNEQIISDLGLAIDLKQNVVPGPGPSPSAEAPDNINNGLLTSSFYFADPTQDWLTGVPDTDGESIMNWVRTGTTDDDLYGSPMIGLYPVDRDNNWSGIFGGIFSLYRVVATDLAIEDDNGNWQVLRYQAAYDGAINDTQGKDFDKYKRNPSIDFVITKDTNLWSRCPVVEMCEYDTVVDPSTGDVSFKPGPSENGADKFDLRKSPSVYRNGKTMSASDIDTIRIKDMEFVADSGMGWFPGYAIDIETGERLNVFFGEDSRWGAFNGRDMIWNPHHKYFTDLYQATGGAAGEAVFGAKHNVYIWGHSYQNPDFLFDVTVGTSSTYEDKATTQVSTAYDEGSLLYALLDRAGNTDIDSVTNGRKYAKTAVYDNVVYVLRPMLNAEFSNYDAEFDPYGFIKTNVNMKIRMANPYRGLGRLDDGERENQSTFLKSDEEALNNNAPMFTFSTQGMAPAINQENVAEDALDHINIVPNPYYAYNSYELKQTQKLVKITNLPENCTISIYNISGGLVRKFEKSSPSTFVDWDLNNEYGIEIAGGVYYIHVNVPEVGEVVLKWFGSLRPIDLNNI